MGTEPDAPGNKAGPGLRTALLGQELLRSRPSSLPVRVPGLHALLPPASCGFWDLSSGADVIWHGTASGGGTVLSVEWVAPSTAWDSEGQK